MHAKLILRCLICVCIRWQCYRDLCCVYRKFHRQARYTLLLKYVAPNTVSFRSNFEGFSYRLNNGGVSKSALPCSTCQTCTMLVEILEIWQ